MSAINDPFRGPRFTPIPWRDLSAGFTQEWLVKGLLPREGLAAIYGKPGSYKSFVAFNLALSVALGESWAGRNTQRSGVIYIAAEGAAGLRKRRAGYLVARPDLPQDIPFGLVTVAPDLGNNGRDAEELVGCIEKSGILPGLIIIDTLSRSLGSADENGAGMAAFVSNVGRIAERFRCLVLIIHHSGWSADNRLRGHSSLHGALDAMILCERGSKDRSALLTVQKLKDDADDMRLIATLSRVVVCDDADGDEITTLIVEGVVPLSVDVCTKTVQKRCLPKSQQLLKCAIEEMLKTKGETIPLDGEGEIIAVNELHVREHYATRKKENTEGEDRRKLIDRRRKSFKRAMDGLLDAAIIRAVEHLETKFLFLHEIQPRAGPDNPDTS